MSIPNGFSLIAFIFLLVSTFFSSPNWVASASPVQQPTIERFDPLLHFKYYHGGYDIRNKHYWASAVFMGVHGYAIGGVWLLLGIGFGIFMILKNASNRPCPNRSHSDKYFYFMFVLVALFTSLVIVTSSLIFISNHMSQKRIERLKEVVLEIGNDAHMAIRRVVKGMTEMQTLLLPYDPSLSLSFNATTLRLRKTSCHIRRFIDKNEHFINLAIHSLYIVHLAIVSVNLFMLVAALVVLLLHWHPAFVIIIICCWILTTLCWVVTGFDFFIHTFAEDTCKAREEFEQNPQNNSLSSILPCMDTSTSDKMMIQIGYTIHNYISQLNSEITELYGLLGLDEENNQNLIGFIKICSPFSGAPDYRYTPEGCPEDSISVGNLSYVLEKFTCHKEKSKAKCKREGKFLPEVYYAMALAYTRSIEEVLVIYPDLQSLSNCTFVKERISDVVLQHCRAFKTSIQLLWPSMLSLSILMVALIFIWIVKAFQDRGKCFSFCSITPTNPI